MNLSYIIAPAIGAFIGYITNFIAIKMLFRPVKPKYIFGFQLPFTPGIIPREKAKLAKSIGNVVGEKLLTNELIIETLTLPVFQDKIEAFIDEKLMEIRSNNQKIEAFMYTILDGEESEHLITLLQNDAADFLYHKINSPEVMDKLTSHISQALEEYVQKQEHKPVFKILLMLNKSIIDSVKNTITSKIKEVLFTDSYAVIKALVHDEIQHILNMRVNDLVSHWEDKIPKIKKIILNSFNRSIRENVTTITSALNIPSIVEKRINAFDVLEVEQLILSVAEKELKAIIWLGALLGLFMGFLMPLFS